MTKMSTREITRFLMQGTFTGKLATVKKGGESHVVPIWLVFDNENSIYEIQSRREGHNRLGIKSYHDGYNLHTLL